MAAVGRQQHHAMFHNGGVESSSELRGAVRQNQFVLRAAQQQHVEGGDVVNVLTVQGALLLSQAMIGLDKALGGRWESVYALAVATDISLK